MYLRFNDRQGSVIGQTKVGPRKRKFTKGKKRRGQSPFFVGFKGLLAIIRVVGLINFRCNLVVLIGYIYT